jgi:hypothetical protein
MALFATTGWAAAEVRNRTVAVAQIRVGSHGHGLQLIYGHVVHLTTFFFVCLLPLHIFALLEFPLGRSVRSCWQLCYGFQSVSQFTILMPLFQPGRLVRLCLWWIAERPHCNLARSEMARAIHCRLTAHQNARHQTKKQQTHTRQNWIF